MSLFGPSGQYSSNPDDMRPIQFTNYARIGLSNFFETNPELFLSRLCKGPPPQFRWLAWSFIASKLKPKVPKDYEKCLRKGKMADNQTCIYDISKDVNRTFPFQTYFSESSLGQEQLRNVLEAYSVYRPDVGYCQSMNFLAGFMLLVSGGEEKQAFWLLYSMLEKSH